ncbi:MAG: aldo/keto reductase, partial [Gemmatimonadota bacterium]
MQATTLPRRRLGSSGLEITPVGFGAWAIGGGGWKYGWGPQDDAASLAAMRHALERGINWIDTAAVYGLGHSEEVVGRLLRDLPPADRPLVFTKGGQVWDDANRMAEPQRTLKPASIRREVDASLRRLGVERIDLYQFHWPDQTGTPVGFGAWAIGGGGWKYGWCPQDDADSLAAMRHALERGINWIDTAAVYGLGHSEEVVGRLLRELPPA